MGRSEDILILAAILLFAANGITFTRPRINTGASITTLAVLTLIVAALGLVAAGHRSGWDLFTTGAFAAGTAVLWDLNRPLWAGKPSRIVQRRVWRTLRRERHGRPLLTLSQVRAEYGQTILDDAARDRVLAELLDDRAAQIVARVDLRVGGVHMLTAYVNGYLESLSEPGRRPRGPVYRGYSDEMLTIAAVCRAAERLRP